MCGILGTLPSTYKQFFQNSLMTLKHRGPDGNGIFEISDEISLGHVRLSILDLSTSGHQPMLDKSNRFTIVFNGEIYNFLEIKEILLKKGHEFSTNSDTEVIIESYKEWGDKCVNHFNGMWAFAIWDKSLKKLFLSRDRFGKKPLYYAHVKDKFIFASEMKAIYPFIDNLQASRHFSWMSNNIFLYEGTEKCLIDGILRFPAGHSAYYENNKLKIFRYWNTLDHIYEVSDKYEDNVEQFRELFLDACRIRMRSDVSIGTALSGGVDSSATICAMSHNSKNGGLRMSSDWQHAFVAAFPGTVLDESYYAKKVTDHLGIASSFLNIDPVKEIDNFFYNQYMFEDLYLTSPIPMIQLYRLIKNKGVSVTLDGHGADELFSGYDTALLRAIPSAGIDYAMIKNIYETHLNTLSNSSQFGKHKSMIRLYAEHVSKLIIKRILKKEPHSKDKRHANYKKLDSFNKHLYLLTHETILPTLLRNYDRYSMISGVEIRMPFLDHRIVAFAMSLPFNHKIRDGYTKKIIRDAVAPYMPKEVAYRKTKIGFNSPIVEWMRGPLKPFFLDTINSNSFKSSRFIKSKIVSTAITNVINGNNVSFREGEKAWSMLTPYLWEQAILKNRR